MIVHSNSFFLKPGEFYFGGANSSVYTVLGSCVAIVLWHPILRLGGMCHFVLPKRPGKVVLTELDGRYGNEAMMLFTHSVAQHNTKLSEYQGKVFGGADPMGLGTQGFCIGSKNIKQAMLLLLENNIHVVGSHVGQLGSRRVSFNIGSGEVLVNHNVFFDAIGDVR